MAEKSKWFTFNVPEEYELATEQVDEGEDNITEDRLENRREYDV